MDIKCLKDWFAWWLQLQEISELGPKLLLFSCYLFGHAKGFAAATRFLAYTSIGHIMEQNPTNHHDIHLPSRVIRNSRLHGGPLLLKLLLTSLEQSNPTRQKAACEQFFTMDFRSMGREHVKSQGRGKGLSSCISEHLWDMHIVKDLKTRKEFGIRMDTAAARLLLCIGVHSLSCHFATQYNCT